MRIKHWQDWVVLAAAAWLYASPFVLGIASLKNPATMLAWICAVVLMISAIEAITVPDVLEEWVDIVAGVALVLGPWVLGFSENAAATGNSVLVGLLVIAMAVSVLVLERRRAALTPPGAPARDPGRSPAGPSK